MLHLTCRHWIWCNGLSLSQSQANWNMTLFPLHHEAACRMNTEYAMKGIIFIINQVVTLDLIESIHYPPARQYRPGRCSGHYRAQNKRRQKQSTQTLYSPVSIKLMHITALGCNSFPLNALNHLQSTNQKKILFTTGIPSLLMRHALTHSLKGS